MQTRRGWTGAVLVAGTMALAACEGADVPPTGGTGEPVIDPGSFVEDTIAEADVAALTCPALNPVRVRSDSFVILRDSSRVVRLEGTGRAHSLWIWGGDADRRTVVVREMTGTRNGVDIHLTPAPARADEAWAMLTLDAGDCRPESSAMIVRRHESGVFTLPDGGYDESSSTAFAVLRGNSGYMLATPTRGPASDVP